MRPGRSPWLKAFRSKQVVAALLALLGAVVAVILVRPVPVEPEPFELPALEPHEEEVMEFRVVTYDRFNLEIPVRLELEVPEDGAGRVRALVAAVRGQLRNDLDAWPDRLELPAIFLLPGTDRRVVLDFSSAGEGFAGSDGADRLARSVAATLREAGFTPVAVLFAGTETTADPATAGAPDGPVDPSGD